MASLDKLPVAALEDPPGRSEAVLSLRAGHPFTCVLSDSPAVRAALLQSVIDTVADFETRFVQVGNPLRSPLTIERVFLQAVGPEADIRLERDGTALTRILAGAAGSAKRLVVVVEQSETLDPEALSLLRAMAPNFAAAEPPVQMLFSGPKAVAAMLNPPEPAQEPAAEVGSRPAAVTWRSRGPFILAVTAGALAGAAVLTWQREPELLRRLGMPMPTAANVAPAAEAAQPQAAVRPAGAVAPQAALPLPTAAPPAAAISSPAADETAVLRREFDRFLSERADTARLSEASRDELFQEFLQRRQARSPSGP